MINRSALARGNRRLQKSALSVRGAGRGGDTELVHVNPAEKQQMERMFGPPSRNPHTGLPEHGFFSKMKKAAGFELWHGKKILKGLKPRHLLFGIDPLSTKLSNKVLGRNDDPLVNQLGGATNNRYEQYGDETGRDPGYAPQLQKVANTIAGYYGGKAIGGLAGQGAGALGASSGVAGAVGTVAGKGAITAANSADKTGGNTVLKTNKRKATSLLLGRASEIADRPYTPYEGQRVAGLSDNEQQASALARTGSPDARRLYEKSESAIDDSNKEFNSANLETYLSPYRDSGIQKENDVYDREKASLLNSKAGAWGGDRAAFQESELTRNHMGAIGDINAQAYKDATNAFFADSDRKTRAAQAYESVGGDLAQLNRSQIQDLMATGGLERTLNQANLDFNYQQFVENRDWDITNLEPLLRALGTTGQPGANPKGDNTAAAIGAAATIAGAYFSAGNGGSSTAPAASTPTSPVYGNDD